MTTFTAPLKVKREFEETTAATIEVSGTGVFTDIDLAATLDVGDGNATIETGGTASFTSIDGTLTLTGVTTTVAAQGTAVPIPASAEGFLEVNIGGTVFRLVYFSVS